MSQPLNDSAHESAVSSPSPASGDATQVFGNSTIEAAYRQKTPGSAERARAAHELFPSGIVHDSRRTRPYPIYVERARGAHKWDVDGNDYIDYYGGHGALILGHGHPEMLEAVHTQLDRGTHFGACHDLEMAWATRVKSLVPCAERVRFTSSGTEANLMALRLARAFTGRDKVVRFMGHFHGWQDHVAFGVDSHLDGSPSPGVLPGIAEGILLADPSQPDAVASLLRSRDDIAAVILEPTGGSFGQLPLPPQMRETLRAVTAERGIVLIFDEVVTGFRVSPGGAQAYYDIQPDLATFAKILAGGLPGGCVTGRKDILDLLDFEVSAAKGFEKIGHQGTYNANPMCAAAGIAALDVLVREHACERASAQTERLRGGLNQLFSRLQVPWTCYGEHSGFHIFTNPDGADLDPLNADPLGFGMAAIKRSAKAQVSEKLRLALLVEGVDISGKPGGIVSSAHEDLDIERTCEAMHRALDRLRAEGELS
ncbi:MAG: aminotransferase class III-fold pyridoxal phosphate-dependent enzyme [Gammaproteobacteria bacterium]|nr:aminotransferase class III-fold pyridoxal phosphate-dependent enzyme [Gammaproteobacteria bacterium]